MTPKSFINALRRTVLNAAVTGTLAILQQPPGKRPATDLTKTAKWFRGLSIEEQEFASNIARLAVHQAVFGFLAVIDGVRLIDDKAPLGRFELRFIRGEDSFLINPTDGEELHDLLTEVEWSDTGDS